MCVRSLVAVVVAGLTVAACAGNSLPGAGPTASAGTLVGEATAGGAIGNRLGVSMDAEDKRRAYAAQIQALESGSAGAPVAWRNPASGRYGSVVPGPAYDQGATKCRQYTHTIYIDGQPQAARGSACRSLDGTWTPVG